MKPILLVQGAESVAEVPGLEQIAAAAEIRCVNSADEMRAALPGAEVLLGWNFRAGSLRDAWSAAADLRWIHWAGAGVDALLFPELRRSSVELTNARGIFDTPMAEWTLGMIICFAKQIPETLRFQAEAQWRHRLSELVSGKRVLVVGVGSIGRAIARLLRAVGMRVEGIGRSARDADPDFGRIHAVGDLLERLPRADYVVLITPLTDATRELFGAAQFAAMAPRARFINLGRGALVVEADLLAALDTGQIAGAALDVFVDEPLPAESPFWNAPNCLVSPHMSGDYDEFETEMAQQFLDNWVRYRAGEDLHNRVDKQLGFVASTATD